MTNSLCCMLFTIGMPPEPAVQSMDPNMLLLPTVFVLHPPFESWAPPSPIEDDVPPNLLPHTPIPAGHGTP